ncbi:hypothetical protein QF035_009051 [Streptomyces umbrinus]|uniref:Uncharacterized protein n=1 Tax=Streptomyces umbrinus TaxID=67370 RepID=A0ABU0T6P6_9ACTN|nr:hypothetical protein [Streptomyces umbrinus]MDQ1031469.1 hypothetical protein [Streptomyces umbrinus]
MLGQVQQLLPGIGEPEVGTRHRTDAVARRSDCRGQRAQARADPGDLGSARILHLFQEPADGFGRPKRMLPQVRANLEPADREVGEDRGRAEER